MSSAPFEGNDDVVLPFAVEPLDVRGRVVRLGASIDTILARHGYPDRGRPRPRRGGGADRACSARPSSSRAASSSRPRPTARSR